MLRFGKRPTKQDEKGQGHKPQLKMDMGKLNSNIASVPC